MIEYIIPLLSSFMPWFTYCGWLAFAIVFVASVPNIIRRFTEFV